MPDAVCKTAFGACFEWFIEGIAYEVTFGDLPNFLRINPGRYEISTGSYLRPMMSLGEEGLIEIIKRIAKELQTYEKE